MQDVSKCERTLRCEQLTKSFGGVRALDRVSLRFPASGITAIIGPNGAGKTTLFNVMSGFLRPDAGRCFYGDREITVDPPFRIARQGVCRTFQDLRLVQRVSVLDNVLLSQPNQRGEQLTGALLRLGVRREEKRNREEAFRYLRMVGLESKTSQRVAELSYGQQKLLTLACCLAAKAQVLLLDEPFAGVDPDMAARISELLVRLPDDGKLIIFIEHDIPAVRSVGDRVIVMDEGRVIADGPPEDVLDRPEIMEAYVG